MLYIYFFVALLMSEAIEIFTALLLYRSRKLIYCIFLCNLLTNPPLNLITLIIQKNSGETGYLASIIVGELAVVIIEGIVITKLYTGDFKRALVVSFLLNTVSFIAGLLILYIMDWHNFFRI